MKYKIEKLGCIKSYLQNRDCHWWSNWNRIIYGKQICFAGPAVIVSYAIGGLIALWLVWLK